MSHTLLFQGITLSRNTAYGNWSRQGYYIHKPKMLKGLGRSTMASSSPMLPFYAKNTHIPCCCNMIAGFWYTYESLNLSNLQFSSFSCAARRRIRYEEEEEDDDEEYGHNEQIAKLELYSQSARGEALLVHALVDQKQVDVLIFKVSAVLACKLLGAYLIILHCFSQWVKEKWSHPNSSIYLLSSIIYAWLWYLESSVKF